MTTTSTDSSVDMQRRWGAGWIDKSPAEVTMIVLQNRAKFGAFQDALIRSCREAGRVLDGPASDALTEICRGLDSLYFELFDQGVPSVRELAMTRWSLPGEDSGMDRTVADAFGRLAGVIATDYRQARDQLARHTIDVVPQACFSCDRFPCACDLVTFHVD